MTRFRPGFIGTGPVFSGVNFDGAVSLGLSGGLVGTSPTKVGILSCWVRMTDGDGEIQSVLELTNGGSTRTVLRRVANNTILFQGRNTDGPGTLSFRFATSATFMSSATEYAHVLMAWDSESNVTQMYVDNSADGGSKSTENVDTGWDADGATISPFDGLTADVAEFYLNTVETLDISMEANRRKFINADGAPVRLGNDGSAPTGNTPTLFLSGRVDDWHINKGTGGGFTENGELTEVDFP